MYHAPSPAAPTRLALAMLLVTACGGTAGEADGGPGVPDADLLAPDAGPERPSVTTGGEGFEVMHVTTLASTGPGSLAEAMGSNRTIVFDVGGTIEDFRWDSSDHAPVVNLTIDGSTAPAPGITLDNGNNGNCLSFQDGSHDIIVKHLRARNAGNDGFSVVGGYNIIFDHCSSSGNRDGNLDITQGAHDVVVRYCLLGPGDPAWSGNMLIAYAPTRDISVHHTLFASVTPDGVGERNPLVHSVNEPPGDVMMVDFRNNLVWKWGRNGGTGSGYATGVDYDGTANVIANYYFSDADPGNAVDLDADGSAGDGALAHVTGNVSGNGLDPNGVSNHALWPLPDRLTIADEDACAAAARVRAEAGARPLDATDQAILAGITSLTGCD
jgi:hypothetical protein